MPRFTDASSCYGTHIDLHLEHNNHYVSRDKFIIIERCKEVNDYVINDCRYAVTEIDNSTRPSEFSHIFTIINAYPNITTLSFLKVGDDEVCQLFTKASIIADDKKTRFRYFRPKLQLQLINPSSVTKISFFQTGYLRIYIEMGKYNAHLNGTCKVYITWENKTANNSRFRKSNIKFLNDANSDDHIRQSGQELLSWDEAAKNCKNSRSTIVKPKSFSDARELLKLSRIPKTEGSLPWMVNRIDPFGLCEDNESYLLPLGLVTRTVLVDQVVFLFTFIYYVEICHIDY